METVRIKSGEYSNTSIIFGNFKMNFNKKGIAEVSVEDENQKAELDKVVKNYGYCIHYLDDETNLMLEAESQKNITVLQQRISSLEAENKALKAANEELSAQNVQLAAENKAYKASISAMNKQAATTTVNVNAKAAPADSDNSEIEKSLNKKTVDELKAMLKDLAQENPDKIKEEEYASLSKKDLVKYIMDKI